MIRKVITSKRTNIMYHNLPKKMRKNDFRLSACPKPRTLFAKVLGLTIPSYPSGQTAVVDVDPVTALNRVTAEDYKEFAQSDAGKQAAEQLSKDLEDF